MLHQLPPGVHLIVQADLLAVGGRNRIVRRIIARTSALAMLAFFQI
jgi:hypothetical protein